jgi:restriction system protein
MAPPLTFDSVWREWVMPLAGTTVRGFNGLENEILEVTWNGVVRVSRNDLTSLIPIAPFRWAVDQVLSGRSVERKEIQARFPHRYSSGVLLILEQVPVFEVSGRPATIRLAPGVETQVRNG